MLSGSNQVRIPPRTLQLLNELKIFSLDGDDSYQILISFPQFLSYWDLSSFTFRFLNPLIFGDYPTSMRSRAGERLPRFSQPQAALVKGSLDFVGINHYTTFYAYHNHTNIIGVVLNDTIADSGAFTVRKNSHSKHQLI